MTGDAHITGDVARVPVDDVRERSDGSGTQRRTSRRSSLGARREWVGYLFIAPNLVGFVLLTLLPLVFEIVVSFTEWNLVAGLQGMRFVGLRNFQQLFADPKAPAALGRTAYYVAGAVPLSLVLGLAAALALNGRLVGRTPLRAMFFLPYVCNIVAISAVWMLLYQPARGPINGALRFVGVTNPPDWLASSQSALPSLIIMAVWAHIGFNMVIYLAGLQEVPKDLLDAAAIDGAGALGRFRHVTLPFLSPTIFFLLVTSIIGTSQSFGHINIMTLGGPGGASTVMAYYVYLTGFQFYQFGYAATLAWALFLVVLAATLVLWRLLGRGVFYGS